MVTGHCSNCCESVSHRPRFYPDPLGLGIASIGGADDGVRGCAPSGSSGRAPGKGFGGEAPEAGSFLLRKWFLHVLEAIVKIQHLYCTCVTMIGIVWIACSLWTIKRWQYICVITFLNLDRLLEFLHYLSKKKILNMYIRKMSTLNTLRCENETSHFVLS